MRRPSRGAAGKARITVSARGAQVDLGTSPVAQPLTVQLKNSDGKCWEATYSAPAKRNDAAHFKDRAD